ncbi:MAG: VOC family protein [Vicinamibacterales bacterium]
MPRVEFPHLAGRRCTKGAARLRAAGVDVQEPRVSPNTQSTLTSFRDPAGIRVELIEMPPGSRIRDAMDRWKE